MQAERVQLQMQPLKPPGDPIQPAPLRATLRRQQQHEQQQWLALQQQRQRMVYEKQVRERQQQQHQHQHQQQHQQRRAPAPQRQMTQYSSRTGGGEVATSGQLMRSGSQSQLLRVSPSDIAAAVEDGIRSEEQAGAQAGALTTNKRSLETRLAQLRAERQRSHAFQLYTSVHSGADMQMRAPPVLPAGGGGSGRSSPSQTSPSRRLPPAPPAGSLYGAAIVSGEPLAPGLTFRSFAINGHDDDEAIEAEGGAHSPELPPPPVGSSRQQLTTAALLQARRTPPPPHAPVGSVASGSPSRASGSRNPSRPGSAGLSRPGSAGADRAPVKLHVTELHMEGGSAGSFGHPAGLDFEASPASGLKATAVEPVVARLPSPGRASPDAPSRPPALPPAHERKSVPAPPSSPTPERAEAASREDALGGADVVGAEPTAFSEALGRSRPPPA